MEDDRTKATLIFEVGRDNRGYLVVKTDESSVRGWFETRHDAHGEEFSVLVIPLAVKEIRADAEDR